MSRASAPPRAVVFDFGGVLFHWRPVDLLRQVLPARAPGDAEARALAQRFFSAESGWPEFDRGTIESAALAERIARHCGLQREEAKAVIDAVPQHLAPLPQTVALLQALHAAGWPLYFLSNMPAPYADHLQRSHGFLACFRDGVFSARVQAIKPEPAIFDLAAQRFGLAPGELVFLDDVPHIVDAARAAGWRALQFTSADAARADLAALGVHAG